jgi:subtilisin family serine protease
VALILALAESIAGGTAAAAGDAVPGDPAGTGRAVVLVSTPELPTGDGPRARSRRHELRSRSRAILDRVTERNGLRVETAVPEIGLLSVELGPGGLPALRRRLAADPRVESVAADVPVGVRLTPNDYAFNTPDVRAPNGDLAQWNLLREGGPGAWDHSKGNGAEVAIIDLGTSGAHADLAPRIVGAQAFGSTSQPLVDTDGHGTHTAGLACADTDNGYGVASLGFDCNLFIAKVELCSDVAAALRAAANRGSDVISMSIGDCPPDGIVDALAYASGLGSVLVAAGANDPIPDPSAGSCSSIVVPDNCLYPSEWVQPEGTGSDINLNRGLVVTAAKYDGTRASFAQMTAGVSVAAYGAVTDSTSRGQQGILSTWPANVPCVCRTSLNADSSFAYLVGTSMATPQVAGVAALIRAVKPNMPNATVVQLVKGTASHCGTYANGVGWGIVRADEAVIAALDKDIDPPTSNVRRVKRVKRVKRSSLASTARRRGRPVKVRVNSEDSRQPRCAKGLPVSGVGKVVVLASRNGGPYRRIGKTKTSKLTFRPKRHGRFAFYSVAVDKAGNREAPPPTPDAGRKL